MNGPTPAGGAASREALRWGACFLVVLLAHVGTAFALLAARAPVEAGQSSPAIMLELAPLTAAPAAEQTDSAPGPQQTQTDTAPPDEQPQTAEASEPEPVEDAERNPERAPVEEVAKADTKPDVADVAPGPEVPPVPKPEVALVTPAAVADPPAEPPPEILPEPKPEPKLETKPKAKKAPPAPKKKDETRRHSRSAPATTAPVATEQVARLSASSPGISADHASALPSWKSLLISHLQRHKRYPAEAQSRGEQGTATLRFTIDRNGRVLSSGLAGSSGVAALDQETLALIHRASPLPPAPTDVPGRQFSFSVPIRFDMR